MNPILSVISLLLAVGLIGLLLLYGLGGNRLLARLGMKVVSRLIQWQNKKKKDNDGQMDYFVPQFIY